MQGKGLGNCMRGGTGICAHEQCPTKTESSYRRTTVEIGGCRDLGCWKNCREKLSKKAVD